MTAPRYDFNVFWSPSDNCWIADVPDLRPCSAHGETPQEALREAEVAIGMWLDWARERGTPIPEPLYRPATNPDWLHNPRAGEMLATEFMEPLGLDATGLAAKLGVPASHLQSVIDGDLPMNGDLDLRLARYFGLSEGFFLRLQVSHDLLEARRSLNGSLDRIVPRAA